MPAKAEKDSITGVETTGHEWDGIRELNNPLPKWWLYTFYATIVFAVVWWILYPAWPWVHGHTTGLLRSDQRTILGQDMEAAHARQAAYLDRIAAQTPAQINADAELQRFAIAGGEVLFKENCAPCHGLGGAGRKGYPTLADDDWLWGGTLEQIDYTIHHGIRNGVDPDARDSQMPAFGADGILTRPQIEDVAQHVLSLTGQATDQAAAERGTAIFAQNCAACHGDAGQGNKEVGAPALNDKIWLYGDSLQQIEAQVTRPRHGVMPTWQGRLSDNAIKMLDVYVHSLGGGQ